MRFSKLLILTTACLCAFFLAVPAEAQAAAVPYVDLQFRQAEGPEEVAGTLQLLALLTLLSLAPALVIMLTSFTRIIVVLSFLRSALATQQTPPNQVLVGLALFLTFFTMSPTLGEIQQNALEPYLEEQISWEEALELGEQPLKEFMFQQTREKDLALFINFYQGERPRDKSEVTMSVLIPAFVISELKTAFQIGFLIYVPFLIIDMVVASTLMSMGIFMVPPIIISLPFKLLLFVMADGWHLVVKSLLESF